MVKEKQGDFQGAVSLYLKAGLPTKAARLAVEQPEISSSSDSVSRIVASLIRGEFYETVSGFPLLTFSKQQQQKEVGTSSLLFTLPVFFRLWLPEWLLSCSRLWSHDRCRSGEATLRINQL